MVQSGELDDLAARKRALRGSIAVRRLECARAAARVAQPLARLDRWVERWQALPPVAKLAVVPATLLVRRLLVRKAATFTAWLGWIPVALNVARLVRGWRPSCGVDRRAAQVFR